MAITMASNKKTQQTRDDAEAERTRKIKEKHLKHIAKISKNLPKIKGRKLTEDEEELAKTKRVNAGKPANKFQW